MAVKVSARDIVTYGTIRIERSNTKIWIMVENLVYVTIS